MVERPELDRETISGMVQELQPSWQVIEVDRSPGGTDFVALLTVETPAGEREVVIKAITADWIEPETGRAEPRILDLIDNETAIPVPTVYGHCDRHPVFPAPYYLMERVAGETPEESVEAIGTQPRNAICRQGGVHHGQLHDLGPLEIVGRIGVQAGELTVLDTEAHPRYESFHDSLLDSTLETIDSLEDGGFFPDLADRPARFADLVPDLREYVKQVIPALPGPNPPTYCHNDYRYGNLVIEPASGEIRAVLDWGILTAAPPEYNLAKTESMLLTPDVDDVGVTDRLRKTFREAYQQTRPGWTFDAAVTERMDGYRFTCRLSAMACLPLWYADGTPDERDERAREHRAFVREYLQ